MKRLLILLVLFTHNTYSNEVTFERLINSVDKNHPVILKELSKLEESK